METAIDNRLGPLADSTLVRGPGESGIVGTRRPKFGSR